VAEHHPARSESLQPHTERSSRPGSELSSMEADVYVWRYTLLLVHARKEEDAMLLALSVFGPHILLMFLACMNTINTDGKAACYGAKSYINWQQVELLFLLNLLNCC